MFAKSFGQFIRQPFGLGRSLVQQARKQSTSTTVNAASEAAATSSSGSSSWLQQHGAGVAKAAITSGTLCATGDLLAQGLTQYYLSGKGVETPWKVGSTMRMLGYGLAFYGPYQYWWYRLLDRKFAAKTTMNFVAKVASNQLILAPVVLCSVFGWNLALQGKSDQIVDKIKQDLWPTMVNGWKFWVPAASVNFYYIPLQSQVLYMSVCGILWTAYLSFASENSANAVTVPESSEKKGKKE